MLSSSLEIREVIQDVTEKQWVESTRNIRKILS